MSSLALTLLLVATEGRVDLKILLPLLVLVAVATHREVFFADETAINGSIVVVCAAFVPFRSTAPLLGPLLCGLVAGVHWAHLKNHVWSKLLVNCSATGVAATLGAATFGILAEAKSFSTAMAFAIPAAVVVYWLVNNAIIAVVLKVVTGTSLVSGAHALFRAESVMILYGVGGALCGLLLREGIATGIAAIVAVLLAVEFRVLTSGVHMSRRTSRLPSRLWASLTSLSIASAGGFLFAEGFGGVGAIGAVLVGVAAATFVVALVRIHHVAGVWDRHLAAGLALVEAPLISAFALAGVLAVAAEIWVAVATLTVILAVGSLASTRLRRRRNRTSDDDQLVAFAAEQAVLEGRSLPSTSSR